MPPKPIALAEALSGFNAIGRNVLPPAPIIIMPGRISISLIIKLAESSSA